MKRHIMLGTVAAATLSAAVAFSTPATAAPPNGPTEPGSLLRLSRSSGGPWSDNLSAPLFGSSASPMVPGGSENASFWAFNTTGTKAYLTLTCQVSPVPPPGTPTGTSVTAYNALANALDIEYAVGGTSSAQDLKSCETNPQPFVVNGRSSNKVDVRLSFSPTQTAAMNLAASYSITVTLSQIPPKGGKPQVLGVQTLVSAPDPTAAEPPAGGASNGTSTGSTSTTPKPGAAPTGKGNGTATKTTNAAALLPGEPGKVTESMPVIAALLAGGALLAALRRRRREAE